MPLPATAAAKRQKAAVKDKRPQMQKATAATAARPRPQRKPAQPKPEAVWDEKEEQDDDDDDAADEGEEAAALTPQQLAAHAPIVKQTQLKIRRQQEEDRPTAATAASSTRTGRTAVARTTAPSSASAASAASAANTVSAAQPRNKRTRAAASSSSSNKGKRAAATTDDQSRDDDEEDEDEQAAAEDDDSEEPPKAVRQPAKRVKLEARRSRAAARSDAAADGEDPSSGRCHGRGAGRERSRVPGQFRLQQPFCLSASSSFALLLTAVCPSLYLCCCCWCQGHLPLGFYEDQMRAFFTQFGEVTRLRLSRNPKTGHSRHYAFIEFAHQSVAQLVADAMHQYMMFGHTLKAVLLPPHRVHADMFGNGRRYRRLPHREMQREQHNAPRSAAQQEKRVARLLARESAKRRQLRALGVSSEFSGYAGELALAAF